MYHVFHRTRLAGLETRGFIAAFESLGQAEALRDHLAARPSLSDVVEVSYGVIPEEAFDVSSPMALDVQEADPIGGWK